MTPCKIFSAEIRVADIGISQRRQRQLAPVAPVKRRQHR